MKGSLQIKNNRYYAVFRIRGNDKPPSWFSLGIDAKPGNKRKAEQAMAELVRKYTLITPSAHSTLFTDYMLEWLESVNGVIKPSTYETYELTVHKKLLPYFQKKSYHLLDLKPMIFTEYFKYLKEHGGRTEKGLSEKSVKNIRGVLSSMLEDARRNELIHNNPVTASRMPTFESNIKKEIVTYSPTEVKHLLHVAKDSESHIYVFLLLALLTGLRRGELLALTWDDIDFENKLLIVNKSRTGTKRDVTQLITTPKTKSSNRIIPLSDEIIDALNDEKIRQNENKKLFGNCYEGNHNFIIRTKNGAAYTNLNAINRVVARLCKKAGLKHCTIHGFRHTVASILDNQDVSLREISILLGHENVSTTEKIYIHRKRTAKRENIAALEEAIFGHCS